MKKNKGAGVSLGVNKYNAVATSRGRSKLEAAVYEILRWRELGGEITELKREQRIFLTDAQISWKPDFCYIEKATGQLEYAEAKGMEDARFRVIKKLYRVYGPAPLHIWMGDYRRPQIVETIIPKGKNEKLK